MKKVEKVGFNCPLTGQSLYYIGEDKESKYYESEDRTIKYKDDKGWITPALDQDKFLRESHFSSRVRFFKLDDSKWKEYFKATVISSVYFPIETTEGEFEAIRSYKYEELKNHNFKKWGSYFDNKIASGLNHPGMIVSGSSTSCIPYDGINLIQPPGIGMYQSEENIPTFPSVFPLVQRVAARSIGLDLASVQPLSAPTGILNYFDYKYSRIPSNVGITYYDDLRIFFRTDNILVGDRLEEKTIYIKGGEFEIKILSLYRDKKEIAIRRSGIKRKKNLIKEKNRKFNFVTDNPSI